MFQQIQCFLTGTVRVGLLQQFMQFFVGNVPTKFLTRLQQCFRIHADSILPVNEKRCHTVASGLHGC